MTENELWASVFLVALSGTADTDVQKDRTAELVAEDAAAIADAAVAIAKKRSVVDRLGEPQ